MDERLRKAIIALSKKENMTDLINRVISDSLKCMDEHTLFIFEPRDGKHDKPGNVVPISDLIGNVSERLKKRRIEVPTAVLLWEVSRVLEHSIKKGSVQLIIARERINGLPVAVIKPEKSLIEYNKNFPEK